MPKNENKLDGYINFEIKLDEENEGKFEGYASVFDNIDYGDDVIEGGAFTKTLKDTKKRVLFFMHDLDESIGGVTLSQDKTGLYVKGELDLDDPRAVKYYKMMKKGFIDRMSIGYRSIVDKIEEKGKKFIRFIKELRLFEVSLIPAGMAMNPKALITNVKSMNDIYEFIKINKDDKEFRDKCLSLLDILPEPVTPKPEPKGETTEENDEPIDCEIFELTSLKYKEINETKILKEKEKN